MLRTTLNMRHDIFLKLDAAATQLGKTRRQIVVMLLMRIMRDIEKVQGGLTLVRYQERDPIKRWHCFSISFRKDENEFFTDLRKLSKFSVSYLVAMAANMYLDELLRDREKRHNYVEFMHHAVGQRTEGGIICWELYWGDPDETAIPHVSPVIHRRTRASLMLR